MPLTSRSLLPPRRRLQLGPEELAKLLLCTALYAGAGTVLTEGLGLAAAQLQPQGGGDAGPAVPPMLQVGARCRCCRRLTTAPCSARAVLFCGGCMQELLFKASTPATA